jgi:predicted nucleic acid-binding protein
LYLIDIPWKVYLNTFDLVFQLRRKGVTIPYTEILIAVTALAHEATLLHVDAPFDRVAQFSNLKV